MYAYSDKDDDAFWEAKRLMRQHSIRLLNQTIQVTLGRSFWGPHEDDGAIPRKFE